MIEASYRRKIARAKAEARARYQGLSREALQAERGRLVKLLAAPRATVEDCNAAPEELREGSPNIFSVVLDVVSSHAVICKMLGVPRATADRELELKIVQPDPVALAPIPAAPRPSAPAASPAWAANPQKAADPIRAAWDADAALRAEFRGRFESYKAYSAAVSSGRARVLKAPGVTVRSS